MHAHRRSHTLAPVRNQSSSPPSPRVHVCVRFVAARYIPCGAGDIASGVRCERRVCAGTIRQSGRCSACARAPTWRRSCGRGRRCRTALRRCDRLCVGNQRPQRTRDRMLPFQERLMLLATRALAALPVDMAQEQLAELLTHAYSGGKLGSSRRPKHRLAGGKADCMRLGACVPARARLRVRAWRPRQSIRYGCRLQQPVGRASASLKRGAPAAAALQAGRAARSRCSASDVRPSACSARRLPTYARRTVPLRAPTPAPARPITGRPAARSVRLARIGASASMERRGGRPRAERTARCPHAPPWLH